MFKDKGKTLHFQGFKGGEDLKYAQMVRIISVLNILQLKFLKKKCKFYSKVINMIESYDTTTVRANTPYYYVNILKKILILLLYMEKVVMKHLVLIYIFIMPLMIHHSNLKLFVC